MVIVVEEQKNKMSLVSLLTWFTILGIFGIATYYIFFKEPATIEYVAPRELGATVQLSKIALDAKTILDNPSFKALRPYIAVPKAGNTGRQNPFLPFEGFSAAPIKASTSTAVSSP